MRVSIALITLLVAVASAGESRVSQESATVESYPSVAALLRTINFVTSLTACGGAILNNRSVLSAARCFQSDGPERWRFRVGSTNWNSGGTVYAASRLIIHEDWDEWAMMNDIAIVQTASEIVHGGNVQPGLFGSFAVPEDSALLTIGWGYNGMPLWEPTVYDDLRSVELTNFNLSECSSHYSNNGFALRDTQLCIGFSSIPDDSLARNKCFGEPGMPVFQGNVIVGIRSYALACWASPNIPSISTRFGGYTQWIQENV